ncbi:MAG: two-component regulator propeller domain-containing protein, partial [Mucilaginibacter sp.]
MITIKKCFSIPVLQITIGIAIAILGFSSCKNATETSTPADTGYKQPGEQPLKFTPIQKIDWAALPSVAIQPVIKKLDFSKLVSHSYDTAGLTPFTRPVTKAKFDYNSLPQKDFDIDKLPSKTLKFKTYLLEPPKLVKANMPHLKNSVLQLYEMGQTQGLEGLITSAIYTDHRGFLWIATDKGLYRYDGENFLVYLHGQIDFYIISLMEDKAGRMWMCLLNNGLEVLDTKAGTLKRTNKSLGLINNSTTSTLLDGQGKIWATFNPGGVAIIDPDMQSMKLVDKTHGLSDTTANCLVQDKNHKIWVGTDAGISVIDFKSKKIKYIDKSHGLRKDTVQNLLFDHDGRLWMAVREKIDVLDLQKKTVNYINEPLFGNPPGPNSFIRTLSQDGKGRVWAGNFNYGLAIIDLQNHGTRAMTFGDGLLPADRVISIDQDSRGQTWIGTAAGLQMVGNNKAIAEQIGTDQTNTLLEDSQGSIWQGTGKGVNIFDRKTKTVKNISTAEGLGHDNIETLNEIDGSISICSDGGWDLLDPSKTTITHLGKEQGLNSKVIYAVLKDNAGRFWIGGTKPGIDVYDPVTKALKSLGKTQGLNGSNTDMKKDSRGRIWIAIQSKGIDVVDPVNWTIQHINDVPGLKDNFNKVLFPDSEGNMWIGTDKGVYFADMDNKKLLFFSIAQGLVNEGVTSILSHNGSTYVSTNGGISVITPTGSGTGKKWHIESFGTSYIGLKTYIGSSLTDQLTKDGLYWWGDKGLTVLDLSKKEAFVPPTLITGINTMDEPRYFVNNSLVRSKDKDTLWDRAENHFKFGEVPKNTGYTLQSDLKWDSLGGPYHMPINLQLPHHQNFIQFHFSSLNFMPHDTAWYRYRLTGVDTGWSEKTFIPT